MRNSTSLEQRGRPGQRLQLTAGALIAALLATGAMAEPVRGGTVTGMWSAEPASLDPLFTNSPGGDSATYNLFAERLVNIMPSGEIVPMLATKWTWSDDRRSLTFNLRPNVTFTDGTPFNADAVKFNLERARDPKLTSQSKQFLTNLDQVEVVDPMTVRFTFKEPSVAMMAVLASEPGVILSPTEIAKAGENFARKPDDLVQKES